MSTYPSIFNPSGFLPQKSVSYKSFLMTGMQNALNEVFIIHPDPILATKFDNNGNRIAGVAATLQTPTDDVVYPYIVLKFLESKVRNAGVGHIEYIFNPTTSGITPFRHQHYTGQMEVGIHALSTLDAVLVSDAIVEIMKLADMSAYANQYIQQIFDDTENSNTLHYINIDTDVLWPIGDTNRQVPWRAENELEYITGYRANIFGEFYSLPPGYPSWPGFVEQVLVYPYTPYDMIPVGSGTGAWLPVTPNYPGLQGFPNEIL